MPAPQQTQFLNLFLHTFEEQFGAAVIPKYVESKAEEDQFSVNY